MSQPLHTSLHRTAKYFMDSGRAQSAEEAVELLKSFGLTVVVGPEIQHSAAAQIALLTLVNLARRTFLAGVEVVGLGDGPVLTPLSLMPTLKEAVNELGARPVTQPNPQWPVAVIGSASPPASPAAWRLTWEGWRAGVVPAREQWALADNDDLPLSPALAASACMAEAFAFHAGDHSLAGKRAIGFSLWKPGNDWAAKDPTEPEVTLLPSRLWLIGMGNLGQAYAWLLASLRYPEGSLELVLQDFDKLAPSNDSTSVLTRLEVLDRMKTRWAAEWLEARGISTRLEERTFGSWTKRQPEEPAVALCGVDNAMARAALEDAGFDLVIESGLGAGPQSFRNVAMHAFPGARTAKELWPTTLSTSAPDVSTMPAYVALKEKGLDACGLAQLASRTVGVPFVGMFAALLVVSELLRRLHGGVAFDVVSASVTSLDDAEVSGRPAPLYDHGFVRAERSQTMPAA